MGSKCFSKEILKLLMHNTNIAPIKQEKIEGWIEDMNKNKKWLLAISMATMITANGIAMAAVTAEQAAPTSQRPAIAAKGLMDKAGMKEEFNALLKLLKIDATTFKDEMKAGKSLVTIAGEHGVSEQTLKDFMIGEMTKRLDAAVKAGKLDADKVDKMKANMEQRVSDMINGKGPMHDGKGFMRGEHKFDNSKLLTLLNIDADTFKAEMKAGKTLVAIAGEHGVSEQALKDFMKSEMTERLAAAVKAGKLNADKADKMKVNMEQRVSDMINGKGPKHDHQGHPANNQ